MRKPAEDEEAELTDQGVMLIKGLEKLVEEIRERNQ